MRKRGRPSHAQPASNRTACARQRRIECQIWRVKSTGGPRARGSVTQPKALGNSGPKVSSWAQSTRFAAWAVIAERAPNESSACVPDGTGALTSETPLPEVARLPRTLEGARSAPAMPTVSVAFAQTKRGCPPDWSPPPIRPRPDDGTAQTSNNAANQRVTLCVSVVGNCKQNITRCAVRSVDSVPARTERSSVSRGIVKRAAGFHAVDTAIPRGVTLAISDLSRPARDACSSPGGTDWLG